jgi:hypothetical protein
MNIRRGQTQQSLFKPCSGSVFGTPAMRFRALHESVGELRAGSRT